MATAASSSGAFPTAAGVGAAETARRNRILTSKLHFDVPPTKVPVIYSPSYDISFLGIEKLKMGCWRGMEQKRGIFLSLKKGNFLPSFPLHYKFNQTVICRHPFDSSKWGRIIQFLIKEGFLDKNRAVEPLEATKDDLLVVHTESYLNSLRNSLNVSIIVEVPPIALFPNCLVQNKVLYPFRKQVGGSVLAAKLAKERGWAINVGGGFHHCSAEKGGGFCAYADISLCIQFAFTRLNITRVMIIDLDAHQGNGHETDFSNDGRVYILDMYNSGIYPFDLEARRYIDQKVELVVARSRFNPDLVVYNAGTDILDGDPLGRLKVSPEGVAIRDEKVFRFARERNIPLLMLTSGGYMKSSARVIADSIVNLSKKNLIDFNIPTST